MTQEGVRDVAHRTSSPLLKGFFKPQLDLRANRLGGYIPPELPADPPSALRVLLARLEHVRSECRQFLRVPRQRLAHHWPHHAKLHHLFGTKRVNARNVLGHLHEMRIGLLERFIVVGEIGVAAVARHFVCAERRVAEKFAAHFDENTSFRAEWLDAGRPHQI